MYYHPPPLVIEHLTPPHTHTFILLHGRGSSGAIFAPTLLATPIRLPPESSNPLDGAMPMTLATAFPHARFVFPTAPLSRATRYRRALVRQWFDNWDLTPPAATAREHLQAPGLAASVAYLHALLRSEAAVLAPPPPGGGGGGGGGGFGALVLGGLSQGCAAALVAMLVWDGAALGAAVGLCGWLPFAQRMREQVEGEDPFLRLGRNGEEEEVEADAGVRAVRWLRAELEMEEERGAISARETAVFLGHGVLDDRVDVVLGRAAAQVLDAVGVSTRWREFEGLAHWYSGEMLGELVEFVREHVEGL